MHDDRRSQLRQPPVEKAKGDGLRPRSCLIEADPASVSGDADQANRPDHYTAHIEEEIMHLPGTGPRHPFEERDWTTSCMGPLGRPRHLQEFRGPPDDLSRGRPGQGVVPHLPGEGGDRDGPVGCDGIRIDNLGPGEVLGWSWILPPYELHYSARALEPTEVIALDGKGLVALFEKDHDLGYEMMKRFAQVIVRRLAATRARTVKLPDPTPAEEAHGALVFLRPPSGGNP